MKRILTAVLALAMALSLAACGGGSGTGSAGSAGFAGAAGSAGSAGGADSGAGSGAVSQSASGSGSEAQTGAASSEGAGSGLKPVEFQEITAVDNENCAIVITGLKEDSFWGYALNVTLENRSADTTYMFSLQNAAINGVECTDLFAEEVAPGKKSNSSISLMDSTLQDKDIGEYTDIELHFRVYDSNDWSADAVAEETVHVYPFGEENAAPYVRESQPGDNVILDNDQATVIVTGYREDEIWGYTADLFLVNKTDTSMMVSVDEASINGFMMDPFYAKSVMGGQCAFSSINWSNSDLEENGITQVEEIEFKLKVRAEDDWMGDPYAEEVITLNP